MSASFKSLHTRTFSDVDAKCAIPSFPVTFHLRQVLHRDRQRQFRHAQEAGGAHASHWREFGRLTDSAPNTGYEANGIDGEHECHSVECQSNKVRPSRNEKRVQMFQKNVPQGVSVGRTQEQSEEKAQTYCENGGKWQRNHSAEVGTPQEKRGNEVLQHSAMWLSALLACAAAQAFAHSLLERSVSFGSDGPTPTTSVSSLWG